MNVLIDTNVLLSAEWAVLLDMRTVNANSRRLRIRLHEDFSNPVGLVMPDSASDFARESNPLFAG